MKEEEAKSVCKDRCKWKEVVSAYPNSKTGVMFCMYVTMHFYTLNSAIFLVIL
jgi:hypothetical protein